MRQSRATSAGGGPAVALFAVLALLPVAGCGSTDANRPRTVVSTVPVPASDSTSPAPTSAPTPAPGPDPAGPDPAGAYDDDAYCQQLDQLVEAGTSNDLGAYQAQLAALVADSPEGHRETWDLLLTLAAEPFSYDNFNRGVDSLDEIGDEVEAQCPAFARVVVTDDGILVGLRLLVGL